MPPSTFFPVRGETWLPEALGPTESVVANWSARALACGMEDVGVNGVSIPMN
jgi:hypothetical protein